jgi:hypothetical protein
MNGRVVAVPAQKRVGFELALLTLVVDLGELRLAYSLDHVSIVIGNRMRWSR